MPSRQLIDRMRSERPDLDLRLEHEKFTDYWKAKPGKKGRKVDWEATWRNWIRGARSNRRPTWQQDNNERMAAAARQAQRGRLALAAIQGESK